jgi:hypothetical protein
VAPPRFNDQPNLNHHHDVTTITVPLRSTCSRPQRFRHQISCVATVMTWLFALVLRLTRVSATCPAFCYDDLIAAFLFLIFLQCVACETAVLVFGTLGLAAFTGYTRTYASKHEYGRPHGRITSLSLDAKVPVQATRPRFSNPNTEYLLSTAVLQHTLILESVPCGDSWYLSYVLCSVSNLNYADFPFFHLVQPLLHISVKRFFLMGQPC